MTQLLGLIALTVLLAVGAAAAPNLLGPTGLLNAPTADTLQHDEYSIGVYKLEDDANLNYSFNFGVRQNLEAGFNRGADKRTTINMKYNFVPIQGTRTGIAAGVIDLTDQVDATLYAVVGRQFDTDALPGISQIRLHAGLAASTGDDRRELQDLFGGLSFLAADRLTVMLEHDGRDFNYGARFHLVNGLRANAGFVGEDHNLVYGLTYNSRF